MPSAEQVVLVELIEAIVNKNLDRISTQSRSFYLDVNPDWVRKGSVPPTYKFLLDWEALRGGRTLPAPGDRLHGQVDAHYNRLALKALGASKNPTYPIIEKLVYRRLSDEELIEQPWVSSELLRFEHGDLLPVEVEDAS